MLIFFSDITWDSLFQRPQQLAVRFARRSPVLWIEPAVLGHRRYWHPVEAAPSLYRLTLPQFPHNARDRRIRTITRTFSASPLLRASLFHAQRAIIRRAMHVLTIIPGTASVLVQNFQFIRIARDCQPARILFDYIDDAFGFTRYPPYVREEWRTALEEADVLTATSKTLVDLMQKEVDREIVLVPNGVDIEPYQSEPARPSDLPASGRRLVVYAGTIASWFDFDLLGKLARTTTDTDFVLIGPVHPDVAAVAEQLRAIPNCSFLGPKPHTEIPRYLLHADAGLIPFVRNALTAAVNPVKLYEYSAAGIPTVSTAFSDDLEEVRGLVAIAADPDDFIRQIQKILAMSPDEKLRLKEKLRTFAEASTWDTRAETLARLLEHSPDR